MKISFKKLLVIISFTSSFFLLSCSSAIDRNRFDKKIEEKIGFNQNSIQGIVFYCGTESEWNYYYIDLPFAIDEKYKIKMSEDIVVDKMLYSSERNNWIIVFPRPYSNGELEKLLRGNQDGVDNIKYKYMNPIK